MSLLRNLTVRVGADLSNFNRNMAQMQRNLRRTSSQLSRVGSDMTKNLTVPFTLAAIGIAKLTKTAMDFGGAIVDMSARTNISIQRLQELEFISGQVGVNFEAVQKATTMLMRGMNSASKGTGETADAFKALGVSITDGNGIRQVSDVFEDVLGSLQKIQDPTKRGMMAIKLFGRQTEELLPLLALNSNELASLKKEFKDLNIAVDDKTIMKFEEFGDRIDKLKIRIRNVGIEFANGFYPIVDRVVKFVENNVIPTVKKLSNWFQKIPETIKLNVFVFTGLLAAIGPIVLIGGKLIAIIAALNFKFIAITLAIAGLITYMYHLYNTNAQFRESVNDIIASIKIMVNNFLIGAREIWKITKNIRETLGYYLTASFIDAFNTIKNALQIFLDITEGNWIGALNNILKMSYNFAKLILRPYSLMSELILYIFEVLFKYGIDQTFMWAMGKLNGFIEKITAAYNWVADKFKFEKIDTMEIYAEKLKPSKIMKDARELIKGVFWDMEFEGISTEKTKKPLDDIKNNFLDLLDIFDLTADGFSDIQNATKQFTNSIIQQTKAFSNFVGLFDSFQSETLSPRRLLSRLNSQTRALATWQKNLQSIEGRGASQTFLAELRALGPSQSGAIKGIAKMSDIQLQDYQRMFSMKNEIAGQEAYRSMVEQQRIDTMIESQINITITDSNIRNNEDTERIANDIIRRLKLKGVL